MIDDLLEADLPAALAIDLASFTEGPKEPAARETQLRDELARGWAYLRAARRDDTRALVGYCLFWHVLDEIHLLNVAVEPASRRCGLGRALLLDMLAWGHTHAMAKVILEARAGNTAALALYASHGFERIRVRKGYYDDGEDGIEMIYEFPIA